MTPELFTQITGYELLDQNTTLNGYTEYKIMTKDSFYQIFCKIDDATKNATKNSMLKYMTMMFWYIYKK